jgi:hypothetical protein
VAVASVFAGLHQKQMARFSIGCLHWQQTIETLAIAHNDAFATHSVPWRAHSKFKC